MNQHGRYYVTQFTKRIMMRCRSVPRRHDLGMFTADRDGFLSGQGGWLSGWRVEESVLSASHRILLSSPYNLRCAYAERLFLTVAPQLWSRGRAE